MNAGQHRRDDRRANRVIAGLTVLLLVAAACDGSSSHAAPRRSQPITTSSTRPGSTRTPRSTVPAAIKRAVAATGRKVDAHLTTPDGRDRTYHLYVPRSLANRDPAPLLIALHGGVGSGQQFERNSGFDGLAEANRFIVVYPDGTQIGGGSPFAGGRVWNGGRCCGPAATAEVDDVQFLSMLIDEVEQQYTIDAARVFATGHSNGAIMSYRLACELSEKIAAIGVQAGSIEVDRCAPRTPVSVLHIHGTADRNIPIGGGKGEGISGIAFHSPLDAVGHMAVVDGCERHLTRSRSSDNPDVSVETWQPCRSGTVVEFVRVQGASHAWMGHESPRAAQALTGPPYAKFDSSAAIWTFLASHPRPHA